MSEVPLYRVKGVVDAVAEQVVRHKRRKTRGR